MNGFLKSLTKKFLIQASLLFIPTLILLLGLVSLANNYAKELHQEKEIQEKISAVKQDLNFQRNRLDSLYKQTESTFYSLYRNHNLQKLLNAPSPQAQAAFSADLQRIVTNSPYIKSMILIDEGDAIVAGATRILRKEVNSNDTDKDSNAPKQDTSPVISIQNGTTIPTLSSSVRSLFAEKSFPSTFSAPTQGKAPFDVTQRRYPKKHQESEHKKEFVFSGFTFLLDQKHNPIIQCRFYACFHGNNEKRHHYIVVELDTASFFHKIIAAFTVPEIDTMLFDGRGRLLATTIKEHRSALNLNAQNHLNRKESSDWSHIKKQLSKARQGYFQQGEFYYIFENIKSLQKSDKNNFMSIVRIIDRQSNKATPYALPAYPLLIFFAILFSLIIAAVFFFWRLNSASMMLLQTASNGIAGMLLLDEKMIITSANDSVQTLCGYSPENLVGQSLREFHTPEYRKEFYQQLHKTVEKNGTWQGETVICHKDGSFFQVSMLLCRIAEEKGENSAHYLASFINISRLKEAEKKLLTKIEVDPLTRCWNSRFFFDELENQSLLTANYIHRHQSCLVLINLDNFRDINNNQGFPEGDKALREFGALLFKSFRETDIIARIEGDTFAIIMPHTSMENCNKVINSFRRKVRSVLQKKLSVSAGMVQITPGSLGKRAYEMASEALLQAKEQGKDQVILAKSGNVKTGGI